MMTNEVDMLNKPLWQLTVGEFMELIESKQKTETNNEGTTNNYVYGLAGLMKIFNCGTTKAQQIKSSGIIDDAITQTGRKIIVNADLALKLMSEKKESKKVGANII